MENIKKKRGTLSLSLTTVKGESLLIGEGADQPTLLVFFSLTCSSCLEAAPKVSQALAPYREQVRLVGIGRDHDSADLETWQAENQTDYQLIADPDRQLFEQFAQLHVPRFYLIDTKGKICYQDVNWHPLMLPEIERSVRKLLP